MLLASTASVSDVHPRSRIDEGFPAKKRFFPVDEFHDVVKVWDNLLEHILKQLEIETKGLREKVEIRSIHCVRIGDEDYPVEEAPVVILVVVRPDMADATAVVLMTTIKDVCISPRYVPVKFTSISLSSPLRFLSLLFSKDFDVRVADTF